MLINLNSPTPHPEQIFGPVLTVLTFRTAKEAIALANNTVFGLGASVWTENISLGLEVAMSLKAGACWINCHNQFDAAAGFGGYRESGYGRDGGKEVSHCVYLYLVCGPLRLPQFAQYMHAGLIVLDACTM